MRGNCSAKFVALASVLIDLQNKGSDSSTIINKLRTNLVNYSCEGRRIEVAKLALELQFCGLLEILNIVIISLKSVVSRF